MELVCSQFYINTLRQIFNNSAVLFTNQNSTKDFFIIIIVIYKLGSNRFVNCKKCYHLCKDKKK